LRPNASVIVPFLGTDAELESLLAALQRLRRFRADELIVADNRPAGATRARAGVRVLAAGGRRSPGFARNRGAAHAGGEWLVMIDADTVPEADLLERYFDPPPAPGVGVLAGGIDDLAPPGAGLAARHSAARGHMSQETTLARGYAQSANMAVRRTAFVAAGGFAEEARAGEDADLCLRLRDAGWGLEARLDARVAHRPRASVPALLRQLARHGAGAAWCERRHPGSFPPTPPAALARRLARDGLRALAAAGRGEREAAAFAALDLLGGCAFEAGRHLSNRVA
jgi:GT2 family glycosyltransferase